MLLSQGYGPTPRKIQPIAPTMSFGFNDGSGKPLTVARQSLMALGQRLGIEGRAVNHRVRPLYAGCASAPAKLHPATVAAVFTDRYAPCVDHRPEKPVSGGDGSIGHPQCRQEQTDFWGTAVVGIERLAAVRNARVIYLDHGNQAMMDKVSATPLWQSLPLCGKTSRGSCRRCGSMALRCRRCDFAACWRRPVRARHECGHSEITTDADPAVAGGGRRPDDIQPAQQPPPAQWGRALSAPDIDDVRQMLFHYSLLPRLTVSLLAGAGLDYRRAVPAGVAQSVGGAADARRCRRRAARPDHRHAVGAAGANSLASWPLVGAIVVGGLVFGVASGADVAGDADFGRAGAGAVLRRGQQPVGAVSLRSAAGHVPVGNRCAEPTGLSAVQFLLPRLLVAGALAALLLRPLTLLAGRRRGA